MPTRLPTLTRLASGKPTTADAPDAATAAASGDSPPKAAIAAATAPSAIVHKPFSAISRFGSTFFNRKTIVATNKVDPSPPTNAAREKRNSVTLAPRLSVRRGSTDGDLLATSMPAGDISKIMAHQTRSTRNLLKTVNAPKAQDVPAAASVTTVPTPTQPPSQKEDDMRQGATVATPLIPHRPDHNSSSGSTTTQAPRRPILSKKASANELALNSIVMGAQQRVGSSRNIVHFDRARVDTMGSAEATEAEVSARSESRHSSDSPPVYTGQYVLDRFSADLTPFERKEVLAFSEVFYYSSMGVKRRRQNGRVVSPIVEQNATGDGTFPDAVAEAVSNTSHSSDSAASTDAQLFNDGYDDERGDYLMLMQDHLAYRYEVLHPLGSGSFGQVVCCLDHLAKTKVAVKVIRNRKKYKEQALIEIQVLTQLHETESSAATKPASPNVVHMVEHFVFRNHLCITFELLGMNLYDYLKLRFFQGMPMDNIRVVATQLLTALAHLRTKHIVHCDLKPENVLIKTPLQCFAAGPGYSSVAYANVPVESICLIDFGSSCFDTATIYTYIQSRFYRSPEVILGHAYDTAIDMWSLGCILVELHTGHPIFAGENETEQLMCMMEILGVPSTTYLAQCKRRRYFFQEVSAVPVEAPTDGATNLPQAATALSGTSGVTYKPMPFTNSRGRKRTPCVRDLGLVIKSDDADFISLLRKCFTWDPNERLTPEAALQEPWILAKASGGMQIVVE